MRYLLGVLLTFVRLTVFAADPFDDKFRQLDELLPTPDVYRAASGEPGHAYWQQRADYVIRASLDENSTRLPAANKLRTTTTRQTRCITCGYRLIRIFIDPTQNHAVPLRF